MNVVRRINQLLKPGRCGEARDKEVVALQGQPPLLSTVSLSEEVFRKEPHHCHHSCHHFDLT